MHGRAGSTQEQHARPDQQQHEAPWPDATVTCSPTWLLTSLQLLAVQPACLRAQSQHVPPLVHQAAGQHRLLLHLEAVLAPAAAGCSAAFSSPAADEEQSAGLIVAQSATGASIEPPMLLASAELELIVLSQSMQLLLQQQVSLEQLARQQQQQQHLCTATGSAHNASSIVNISISFPAQTSQSNVDAVHLLLTVSSGIESSGATTSASSSRCRPPVLVAEVPVLLVSAAAQQEVQQLLLPGMRQDVQTDQAQRHRQPLQLTDDQLSRQVMVVESAVWKHFYQLSRDIYTIVQLADATNAASSSSSSAADRDQAIPAVVQLSAAGSVPPPAVALEQLAATLVLPLLLPFLAAHGLYNTLQLLLERLPQHLQLPWRQQQLARLQSLGVLEGAVGSRQLPSPAEQPRAGAVATGPSGVAESSCSGLASTLPPAGAEAKSSSSSSSSCSADPAASRPSAADAAAAASSCGAAAAGASAGSAVASAGASWLVPLSGFAAPAEEQRYVAWKHRSLLHLDWLSALFDLIYLAVLVKRMLREPTTLFYFLYIVIKTLPHVPLMLGRTELFLRHRELWLFLIGPACAVLTWLASATSIYLLKQQPLLLTASAFRAFWQGRGELATSIMRPFMQHMRLRPYTIYVTIDAMTSTYILSSTYGFAEPAARWGFAAVLSVGLCFGLDLSMRRLFVAQQQRQQQQQACAAACSVASAAPAASTNSKLA